MRRLTYLRILLIVVIILASVLCLASCEYKNRPCDQPLTKWISEDGTISFEVNENGTGYGTITIPERTIAIEFNTGVANDINIYRTTKDGTSIEMIEWWSARFIWDDRFTVVVPKNTTYFEPGQRIKFIRVDEGKGETNE